MTTQEKTVRKEIISIPEQVFDYITTKLKYDFPGELVEKCGTEEEFDKLSGIKFGDAVAIIGYKRYETSSSLLLWTYPYRNDSYKVKICCGFFRGEDAIYEKVHISFPSFGLTIFSPDQIGIISLILEGLKNVTPSEPFRRVEVS